MSNIFHSVAARLAPTAVGRIEHAVRRGAGLLPMNGQAARLEMAREIFELCDIDRVIETGAFRGATTEWLAQFGKPITTFEISPVYAAYARARLSAFGHVEVRNVNSADGLKVWIDEMKDRTQTVFCYLDAHWYDYLPLREELELIFGNLANIVVMIDDFAVPDDPDYSYDDYGAGKALDMDYVASAKIGAHRAFFPAVRGKWETGARRGSVVIAGNPRLIERLRAAPLMREWLPPPM